MDAASTTAPNASGRKKTSLSLNPDAVADARALGLNISDVCNAALEGAVRSAARAKWIEENRAVFEAQAEWHRRKGHPLADAVDGPLAGAI